MRSYAILTALFTTITVAGCHVNVADSEAKGHVDCNGGWADGEGQWGDACTADEECAEGLLCDSLFTVCWPDDGTPPCSNNSDCPVGNYCDPQVGGCVEGGVCSEDDQCGEGLTCDEPLNSCVPGEDPPPVCAELDNETDCSGRGDCEPVYAGVNCSCGADCTCTGGEAGCVCESFEYFKCDDVAAE